MSVTDRLMKFLIGIAIIAIVVVPNYYFWHSLIAATTGKALAIAMLIVWCLIGSWTSALGIIIALIIMFSD